MSKFLQCEICESKSWETIYKGEIRQGRPNTFVKDGLIKECLNCKAQRLSEKNCLSQSEYRKETYRNLVNESNSIKNYYEIHDNVQLFYLNLLNSHKIRNKTVLEVGCGAGSFLDLISNYTKDVYAIEPNENYKKTLNQKGYNVFTNIDELKKKNIKFDYIFSFQVIEHVLNPKKFLLDIRTYMNKKSLCFITTPNRDEILMKSNLKHFYKFYYRKVHRWYFNSNSIKNCIKYSKLKCNKISYIHKYDFENFLKWTKNKKFSNKIEQIDFDINSYWKTILEREGLADLLCVEISL